MGRAWRNVLKPDICVIGAGSGGLSVAAAAAAFGVSVVLVEKGKMGGDCLNTGCVPSKSLIAAGKRARAIAEARAFGMSAATGRRRFRQGPRPRARRHRRDRAEQFEGAVHRPRGARDRRRRRASRIAETVVVGDGTEIRARRFVIATGSSPSLPPIPGLETDAATSPTRRCSISPRGRSTSSSSARVRSASSWRRPFAGSAPR